jgi:imidazolonepropionase-like amidohydrolase
MKEPPTPLILAGGAAWDDVARTFRAGCDVLIEGGRIAAVGAGLPRPAGARVLDCQGRFLLPGLVDCHVHITSDGDPGWAASVGTEPVPLTAWKAAEHARRTVRAGVTTVRELGAPAGVGIQLARAIEEGRLVGPRVLAAGQAITMTGGHGRGGFAVEADGADGVRKAVREQLKAGATAIKLIASGGVMTPGVNPQSPSFTEAEMAAGVEEAHNAFRVVAAHAQATEGIKRAVRAGVDSIEHGVWLDEEAICLMAERGTYFVPTLTAPHHIAHGRDSAIPAFMVEKALLVEADHIASFRAALRAGVRVAMGTDQGTPLSRPGENAQEALRMAEHGLSPAAAILAATAWGADLLNLEAGRLEAGLHGDVLVLASDPLSELAALARDEAIVAVVARGRVVRGPSEFEEDRE